MSDRDLQILARDAAQFVDSFRHVFDFDWHYTKRCLCDDIMIPENRTFLQPGLDNLGELNAEQANWTARAGLLDAYRDLSETLTRLGVHPDQLDPP